MKRLALVLARYLISFVFTFFGFICFAQVPPPHEVIGAEVREILPGLSSILSIGLRWISQYGFFNAVVTIILFIIVIVILHRGFKVMFSTMGLEEKKASGIALLVSFLSSILLIVGLSTFAAPVLSALLLLFITAFSYCVWILLFGGIIGMLNKEIGKKIMKITLLIIFPSLMTIFYGYSPISSDMWRSITGTPSPEPYQTPYQYFCAVSQFSYACWALPALLAILFIAGIFGFVKGEEKGL